MQRPYLSCIPLLVAAACDGPSPIAIDAQAVDAPLVDTRWQALPDVIAGPIQETGVAELSGRIYVVGGIDADLGISSDVRVYDIESRTWNMASPLPQALHHAHVAATGGKLYVLGGLVDGLFRETGASWVYDPATDEWSSIASMDAGARGGGAAAAIGDKIYVAGGLRATRPVADFSVYDIATDTWDHTLEPLPEARDHLVAATVDGVFYAISGRAGNIGSLLGGVMAYDPALAAWSARASLPTPRGGMAAGVVDGRIIVVGGEGAPVAGGVFAEVESYDPVSDTWTALGTMPSPRHGMGAAGYQGTLYVPGGADRQGFAAVATFDAFTP